VGIEAALAVGVERSAEDDLPHAERATQTAIVSSGAVRGRRGVIGRF
jgi:hypothetical protein